MCLATSRSLTCLEKISRTNRSENKASFVQVGEKKEAWAQVLLWNKQNVTIQVDAGQLQSKLLEWSVCSWDFMFPSGG